MSRPAYRRTLDRSLLRLIPLPEKTMEPPSTKPYLLRALHEWCCDNGFTPYISVFPDATARVPREFVRD